jgi:3-hydroxybutyryl-CoA dehydrogenase
MDRDIKKILIVGAGVMGHGIAQTFAQAGYQVSLVDVIQKTLGRALGLIKSSLDTFTQEGLLTQSEIPEIIGRITLTTS